MSAQQREQFGSLVFANEFLKTARGVMNEQTRKDSLPSDVSNVLANAYLEEIMAQYGLDPEALVWGLVQVIELMVKFSGIPPEALHDALDSFIAWIKENPKDY